MAVRSGAGTGVVVSLVVFILTTVFLLILTIVFYSGQTKAIEAEAKAVKTQASYIKQQERNNPTFKQFEEAARSRNQSVTAYLDGQMQNMMQFVSGNPSGELEGVRQSFSRLGVSEDPTDVNSGNILSVLDNAQRAIRDRENEIDRLKTQLQSQEGANTELQDDLARSKQELKDRGDAVDAQMLGYRESITEFQQRLDDTVSELQMRVDRLKSDYESRINMLEQEIDEFSEERVVHLQRIDDLEGKVRQEQIKAQDPALLVDGRIIDSAGSNDEVFIDRGRRDHIIAGMTFEAFDDAGALQQVQGDSDLLPRGKASLQVIKVGETTSTCKIVRSVPGRPVVKNDIIANAVYDPTYTFKFLVHGKFDINGDAVPTEAEAEYIRSLVIEWGGQIVTGDELPGDLDFLVLGVEPPPTPNLRENAPRHEMEQWVLRKQARQSYNRLKQQATDAQIPVLNDNRFFLLTGFTAR